MNNLINDLSTLTTIPEKTLLKLVQKSIYCIAEDVEESVLSNEEITQIDIGIGTLLIKNNSEDVKYRFIPNDAFNKVVTQTLKNKLNSLEDVLNESLANKIINVYKDIC